jgi:hypothetical protein
LSDLEITFVSKDIWSNSKKLKILKDLQKDSEFDIHLKGFLLKKIQNKQITNYSSNYRGYVTLDFYDWFKKPVFVYKKDDFSELQNFDMSNSELPVWEAWKLIINRLGDLLDFTSRDNHIERDEIKFDYLLLKVYYAIADACLIINHKYSLLINEKERKFEEWTNDNIKTLTIQQINSLHLITAALQSRKEHDLRIFANQKTKNLDILDWITYFFRIMLEKENINPTFPIIDSISYLNKRTLMQKYLETSFSENIIFSNILRLYKAPKLSYKIRLNSFFLISLKHWILILIQMVFLEYSKNEGSYKNSKALFFKMFKTKNIYNLNDDTFVKEIILFWKSYR